MNERARFTMFIIIIISTPYGLLPFVFAATLRPLAGLVTPAAAHKGRLRGGNGHALNGEVVRHCGPRRDDPLRPHIAGKESVIRWRLESTFKALR